MTFRLNEAPDIILSAIRSTQISRGCGYFWSIFCCPFTFGGTICVDEQPHLDRYSYNCCFPKPINIPTESSLSTLTKVLETQVKVKNAAALDAKGSYKESDYIEWQVTQTIALTKNAVEKMHGNSAYKTALQEAITVLETRSQLEASFKQTLENSPLLTVENDLHSYGMSLQPITQSRLGS